MYLTQILDQHIQVDSEFSDEVLKGLVIVLGNLFAILVFDIVVDKIIIKNVKKLKQCGLVV